RQPPAGSKKHFMKSFAVVVGKVTFLASHCLQMQSVNYSKKRWLENISTIDAKFITVSLLE
ncbi:MAG: hypothetical protein KAU22_11200, partial [Desulfuromonadales bacterium]|nr:hypothetical protein [Desulfuromonadales bacterium]